MPKIIKLFLKSANISRSYSKNNTGTDTVYMRTYKVCKKTKNKETSHWRIPQRAEAFSPSSENHLHRDPPSADGTWTKEKREC